MGTNPGVLKNRGQQPSVLQQKRSHARCVTLLTCDQQEKKEKEKGGKLIFQLELQRGGSEFFEKALEKTVRERRKIELLFPSEIGGSSMVRS